jgi:hypothetical protein
MAMPPVNKPLRHRLNVRAMMDYLAEKGCEPSGLSNDELRLFYVRPNTISENSFPMARESLCFVCWKKTLHLDRFHLNYACSNECLSVMDKKHEEGETIPQHPNAKHLGGCE